MTTARRCPSGCATIPDPETMFMVHGADAMRWFLLSSPVLRGGDMAVKEQGIRDAVRGAIHPLWNAWYFFTLYANADGVKADAGRASAAGVLDRYVLAKLRQAVDRGHRGHGQLRPVRRLPGHRGVPRRPDQLVHPPQPGPVLGYLGRGRGRRPTGDRDQQDAFDTLATVLEVLCRTAAPLLPLVTESVWRGITGGRQRPSGRLARRRPACRATPSWSRSWTGSARCARPPIRSARPRGCGPGCRWRR